MSELLPLFPLGVVLFPGEPLPLHIFEPRYRLMLERCLAGDRRFGVVLIREGMEAGGDADPFDVGTVARILRVDPLPDGRSHLLAVGEQRFRIESLDRSEPYLQGRVEWLDEAIGDIVGAPAAVQEAMAVLVAFLAELGGQLDPAMLDRAHGDPVFASYAVASAVRSRLFDGQVLLEQPSATDRLRLAATFLNRDLALMKSGVPPHGARPRPPSLN